MLRQIVVSLLAGVVIGTLASLEQVRAAETLYGIGPTASLASADIFGGCRCRAP